MFRCGTTVLFPAQVNSRTCWFATQRFRVPRHPEIIRNPLGKGRQGMVCRDKRLSNSRNCGTLLQLESAPGQGVVLRPAPNTEVPFNYVQLIHGKTWFKCQVRGQKAPDAGFLLILTELYHAVPWRHIFFFIFGRESEIPKSLDRSVSFENLFPLASIFSRRLIELGGQYISIDFLDLKAARSRWHMVASGGIWQP